MKVLFDNGTPKPIERVLTRHEVFHARQIGWHELKNGELLIVRREKSSMCLSLLTGTFATNRIWQEGASRWLC
jgi:hypothetical protein